MTNQIKIISSDKDTVYYGYWFECGYRYLSDIARVAIIGAKGKEKGVVKFIDLWSGKEHSVAFDKIFLFEQEEGARLSWLKRHLHDARKRVANLEQEIEELYNKELDND